jgi:DNA-binding transcriptional regulator LsrR (DeoR family)
MEKLVFAEIHSLDNDFGCVAGNEHFVEMFGITSRSVQRIIKDLKDKALIEVKINKSDDTRVLRVLGRFAHLSEAEIAEIGFLSAEIARRFTGGAGPVAS